MNQISEQARHLHLRELLIKLGSQVTQINQPLSHVLILVERRLSCVCHMLHNHKSHHVESQILTATYCLDLSFDLVLVGFGCRDHHIKG